MACTSLTLLSCWLRIPQIGGTGQWEKPLQISTSLDMTRWKGFGGDITSRCCPEGHGGGVWMQEVLQSNAQSVRFVLINHGNVRNSSKVGSGT
mmetsp:Transcript_1177/g.2376  ORF Transcript_1177/g.2376 Transcript_1177/m.2376 type:complete len:93 (-) Transcript_1177:2048-2326(-)